MDQVEIGSVFAGHRIDAVAGRGGMGVVYVATHLALNRRVALKLITPELAADEGFRERFKQESMTAASIDHPNVIPIFHAGEEDGKLYITMRYVEGTDLREMITRKGKIVPGDAARIISEVAAALDAAHAHGLVHRDVKPANVLMGGSGQAYLTDFGLTKHAGSASGLTKTGMFVGTLDYIAPEQLQGGEVDARVDVYALGCVLYQSLTGNVPFPRDTEPAKIWAHMQEPPPSVAPHPDVPDQFEEVIRRAMAKKPDDRYPSAGDLGRAALAAAEARDVGTAERSVATGDAAPSGVTAVPLPPPTPETYVQAPAPSPQQQQYTPAPPPPSYPQQPTGPGDGAPPPRRNLLPFAIAGAGLVVLAAIVAVVLSSGGGDKKPAPTVAADTTPTTTTPATTTPAPAAGDEKAKSDIQLALSTTLKAARENDKLVFCGGLSLRYQNEAFGGAIECQDAAAKGNIPKQFKSASDASSSTTVNGNRATVITVDGNTFQFVKGPSFWTIDGLG
jgi:serine/threonine protein kinase